MKPENFNLAMAIFSESHSVHLIINKPPISGAVADLAENPTIHIKNCPAAVINQLLARKFSVSMCDGLLSVDDYSIS